MGDQKTRPAERDDAAEPAAVGRGKRRKKSAARAGQPVYHLKARSDPRSERRYEPKATKATLVTILGMSIGGVLAGAGTYGQWFRAEALGPHKYAPYLLGAGAVVLLAVSLLGEWSARAIRVGDAGIALEKDPTDVERIAWREVTEIVVSDDMVTFQAHGRSISIPRRLQPQAVARALTEARARIPAHMEDVHADVETVDDSVGEVVALEPPQVAGLRCKQRDKLIAFERDARLCGRCGELYHKDSVPARCATCEARLRA